MWQQERVKQKQVEGLMGTTLNGYKGILELDGRHYAISNEGGLFKAVTKFTVNNSATLGQIVENMIGMTLKTEIPAHNVITKSNLYNENTSQEEINDLLKNYELKVGEAEKNIKTYLANEKTEKQKKVANFKDAMLELQETYKSGDINKIASAIENVSEVALWGSRVPVKPLYDAAGAMLNVAKLNAQNGFPEAWRMQIDLYDARENAKVKNVILSTGNKEIKGAFRHAPDETQIYRGPLDHEFIARDIMHLN